jgi:hypothetical protein
MKLLKVKNGLIEAENFFLASSFDDFAGSANVSRDIATGKLKISSNNKIERSFNYNEFVIELEKENSTKMGVDDYSMIYFGNINNTFGIKDDDLNAQNKYWKVLKQDNYIQAYTSTDGVNYTNIGGTALVEGVTKQGFVKYGSEDFILNNYNVYDNPYVTVQNFPENTLCELYDSDNNLLKTRVFDVNMECKIFLDSNNLHGHLIFKDPQGSILFTTDTVTFGYGDVWVISPYNFEILYLGNVVTNINPALLQDLSEMILIKNVGDVDYTSIAIGTETTSNDLIQLSTDGITFTSTLTLDFALNEEKQIYVQIIKNADNHNFNVRDFQLVIN